MNAAAQEKIYRIWSERKQDDIAVRIRFTIEDQGPCRLIRLGVREEWH
jgi:hypothetical protein